MPTLNRDGVSLYYEVHGEGPVLLLTHGFASTSQMWAAQVGPFSQGRRVVTWDMRGHGRSDAPDDPSAYCEAETVADMAALLDAVGAERAVIGGMSLGGYMSLGLYRRFPKRVMALLLVDTGPGFKKDEAREAWNQTARGVGDAFASDPLGTLATRGIEARTSRHERPAALAHVARGMLTQQDGAVMTSLPDIAVPTLVVVGADDAPYLAAADYMAGKIPGARKVVIPNAGHAANVDQPALFNAEVLAFLDR
jgi:pimeloyl-ACP methyl ester carboxylesterase